MTARRPKADPAYLWVVRRPQGLIGHSEFDADMIARYAMNARLIMRLDQPRDEATLRGLHGLIKVVADAIGKDFMTLRQELKYRAGFVASLDYFDGAVGMTARSFTEIDQAELFELSRRIRHIIETEILPGVDLNELLAQSRRYTGMKDDDL